MRVYLPCTLPVLSRLLDRGELSQAPLRGFAVTPALREWYSSGDLEELEYVAMAQAARGSLRLLLDDSDAPPRRVVLAVEITDAEVARGTGYEDPALVELTGPVALRFVVSGHVDDAEAMDDIRAAVAALPKADEGDDDARFTVDSAEGHDLLWYASQELPYLTAPGPGNA
ncbi:MAG: hypothetical protein ABJB47_23970 [Actinomycetota bacterium]